MLVLRPLSSALAAVVLWLGGCSSPAPFTATQAPGMAPDSVSTTAGAAQAGSPLQVVAEFTDPQLVAVAVAPGGEIFACFGAA